MEKVAGETTVTIINPVTGKKCKDDQVGEIWVSSPCCVPGYAPFENNTSPSLKASMDGHVFTKTNLLGCMRPMSVDNPEMAHCAPMLVFVTGDLNQSLVIRGYRYDCKEIERCIENSHTTLTPNGSLVFQTDNHLLVAFISINQPNHITNVIPLIITNLLEERKLALDVLVFMPNISAYKSIYFQKLRSLAAKHYVSGSVENSFGSDEKLEESELELANLEKIVKRNEEMATKMMEITNSFDTRLKQLEECIVPIYRGTQSLTKVYANVDKTLQFVSHLIKYFDLIGEEEVVIGKGPSEQNMEAYLSSCDRLSQAIQEMSQYRFKNADKSLNQLKSLYNKGMLKLEGMFRTVLSVQSGLVDPMSMIKTKGDAAFEIQEKELAKLKRLAGYLSLGLEKSTTYQDIYVEVRSFYLVKSLQNLAQLSVTTKKTLSYEKGTHAFISYTQCLLKMMKTERAILQALIESEKVEDIFLRTLRSALLVFKQTGEAIVNKRKGMSLTNEFFEILTIIDVAGYLMAAPLDYEESLHIQGKMMKEIWDVSSIFADAAVKFLPEYVEELKSQASKTVAVPADSTVHEITTNTLNYLKRLMDYQEILASLFPGRNSFQLVTYVSNTVNTNRSWFIAEVLKALQGNLESKAKAYKKPIGATVFLMNNHYYIMKSLKNSELKELSSKELVNHHEKAFLSSKETYIQSWKSILEYCKDLSMTKATTKAEKRVIKEKFKSFNTELDENCRLQKTMSVADIELKYLAIKEVKELVLPVYTDFYETYRHVPFTKKTQKYIKYDLEGIEAVLGRLFEA